MTHQHPLTLVAVVRQEKLEQLTLLLKKYHEDLEAGVTIPFEATGTIHYARMLLLRPESNAKPKNTNFVFSTDYDGDEETHLNDLCDKLSNLIDTVFDCCEGYPEPAERNKESRRSYLIRCKTPTDAFYAGAPGRTLQQIQQESKLRDHLWKILQSTNWKNKSAVEIHTALRENVLSNPEFEWVKENITIAKNKWWVNYSGIILLVGSILTLWLLQMWTPLFTVLIILGSIIGFVLAWILVLHFVFEVNDKPLGLTPSRIDESHIRQLEEVEDIHNQNQFSQLIPMKPGRFRTLTLQALMIYAKIKIYLEFEEGKLMGIPTIHFARWLRVENGKQMLFFSNFDGSWQQYLGDFIDKSGWGLTGIFSNTENFPVTRYLFWGGAYDEEHFLAWSRYYQIPTQVWYCAYPKLSIKNVNNNTYIRYDLMKDLSESKALEYLKRF